MYGLACLLNKAKNLTVPNLCFAASSTEAFLIPITSPWVCKHLGSPTGKHFSVSHHLVQAAQPQTRSFWLVKVNLRSFVNIYKRRVSTGPTHDWPATPAHHICDIERPYGRKLEERTKSGSLSDASCGRDDCCVTALSGTIPPAMQHDLASSD